MRTERLRRAAAQRLRRLRFAAVWVCLLAAVLAGGLFFPTQPGPAPGAASLVRARDLLHVMESRAVSQSATGRETTLSVGEDCLAALILGLVEEAGGQAEVWVRSRGDLVRVWMRLATPVGVPAVIELRVQPSLLDGLLFCGLRGARVGIWPFPLSWQLALHGEGEGSAGWVKARGTCGYAFPASFVLQGRKMEIVELWPGDGVVEVTLRPVSPGGE